MTIEEAHSGGWRAVASWSESTDDTHRVSLELDRNMGGMWPRVIVDLEAQRSDTTTIALAPSGVKEDSREGAHQFTYTEGIEERCVAALLLGVVEGLDAHEGIEVRITSGGVAVDTAEQVCRIAARVASSLLVGKLTQPRRLSEVLKHAVS